MIISVRIWVVSDVGLPNIIVWVRGDLESTIAAIHLVVLQPRGSEDDDIGLWLVPSVKIIDQKLTVALVVVNRVGWKGGDEVVCIVGKQSRQGVAIKKSWIVFAGVWHPTCATKWGVAFEGSAGGSFNHVDKLLVHVARKAKSRVVELD